MNKQFFTRWRPRLLWFSGGALLAVLLAFSFAEERRFCVIGLDKVNVLYRGIDNPLRLLVRGVTDDELKIETEGITLTPGGASYYSARAGDQPIANIRVSGGKLEPVNFSFRVKSFPNPELMLGSKRGGEMKATEFRAQQGIYAQINCCGFDAKCEMVSYVVTRFDAQKSKNRFTNTGARFTPEVRPLIDRAQAGDTYIFSEVNVRCPGDKVARILGPMTFKIK